MDRRRFRFLFTLFVLPIAVAAATSSCGSTIIVEDCDLGETDCDGSCVDLLSDPDNCGDCGLSCAGGACVDGLCTTNVCNPPNQDCGGACVDTASNPDHCGGCFIDCPGVCSSSQCLDECPPGLTNCGGACVDTLSNQLHCGNCNDPCSDLESCIGGECSGVECQEPFEFCNGACVDTEFDEQHCGGCNNPCEDFETCQFSQCIGGDCEDPVCSICDVVFLPSDLEFQATGTTIFSPDNHIPFCTGVNAPEVLHVYTAPQSGVYTIDTVGSSYDTTLVVMTDFCEELTCADDVIGFDAQVQLDLVAGQTIFIIVDGFDAGEYALNVSFGGQCPPGLILCDDECVDPLFDPDHCNGCFNDCDPGIPCEFGECISECDGICGTCEELIFLPDTVPQVFQGSTVGVQNGLASGCADASGGEILHFFQAPVAGTYVFSTANSGFDTVLSLLDSASCGELGCNDNFGGQPTSRISTFLTLGQSVYISVDGANGAAGNYNLSITGGAASTCPTMALPSSVPQTITGSTTNAPNNYTPTCASSNTGEHTFTFTAPTSGSYLMDTFGSNYDTMLYVLNATCTGQQLACNDDTGGLQSQLSVSLTAGETYTIIVDGYGTSQGSYTLHIQ